MTIPPRKPTAREAWVAIDDASFKAEVDRVVAMSDEEVEAELVKDGFDPAELAESESAPNPQVHAVRSAAERAVARERKIQAPIPLRRTRWTVLLAAASVGALATALGGAGIAVVASDHQSIGNVAQSRGESATWLRGRAFDACDRHEWQLCLQRLDAAKELDAEGDHAKMVQDARATAKRGLGQ